MQSAWSTPALPGRGEVGKERAGGDARGPSHHHTALGEAAANCSSSASLGISLGKNSWNLTARKTRAGCNQGRQFGMADPQKPSLGLRAPPEHHTHKKNTERISSRARARHGDKGQAAGRAPGAEVPSLLLLTLQVGTVLLEAKGSQGKQPQPWKRENAQQPHKPWGGTQGRQQKELCSSQCQILLVEHPSPAMPSRAVGGRREAGEPPTNPPCSQNSPPSSHQGCSHHIPSRGSQIPGELGRQGRRAADRHKTWHSTEGPILLPASLGRRIKGK